MRMALGIYEPADIALMQLAKEGSVLILIPHISRINWKHANVKVCIGN